MKRGKKLSKIDGTVYRDATIGGIVDEEERTVKISFSSELPVLRASWFDDPWIEVLGHKDGEVNLQRLNNGATVHYNHSRSRKDRVGVVEMAALIDGRGEAIVRFSKRDDVDDVWQDVKDDVLRNVSVGYSIDERTLVKSSQTRGEPDEYRITRWTPMELSFVDIPADPTVGVGRDGEGRIDAMRSIPYQISYFNHEDSNVKLQRLEGETDEALAIRQAAEDERVAALEATNRQAPAPTPSPTPTDPTVLEAERQRGIDEGRVMENERRTAVEAACEPFKVRLGEGYRKFVDGLLADDKVDVEGARVKLLAELGKETQPAGNDAQVIATSGEKFRAAAMIAVAHRAGLITGEKWEEQRVIADEVRGFSLFEMARRCLELEGATDTGRLSRMDLVARAFTSSDFPLILADAANKSMLKGFDESPETWQIWAQTGNLSDFKIGRRVNLSSFNDLELVAENGEFHYGTFTEQGETIVLATYGKLFAISRQAVINDDLSAFTVIPQRMGRAASRVVGDLAYGSLTSNPLLGDGIALFAAAHNNLNESGAGGTPLSADAAGIAAIAAMRNAMALQTDASGSATGLNIRPSHFLVPVVLEDIARALMTDTTEPGQANPA